MSVEAASDELLPQMTLEEALEFLESWECHGSADNEADDAPETARKTDFSVPSAVFPTTPPDSLNLNAAFTRTTSYGSPCASENSDWGANASSCSTTCSDSSETFATRGFSAMELDGSQSTPATQALKRTPKKSKKTSKLSSSKTTSATIEMPKKVRKRKHNKTEILALREEVLHLTARLAQRQKLFSSSRPVKTTFKPEQGSSNSLVVATNNVSAVQLADLELQKLEVSKTVNRKLKAVLTKQIKLCTTFQRVFEKQVIVKQIPESESEPQAGMCESASSVPEVLHRYLDEFYCTTDDIIASISSWNTAFVFSNSHVYQDPMRGQVIKFITNTPLATSLYQLDKCLWSHFASVYHKKSPDRRKFTPPMHVNSLETQYTTSVTGDFGQIFINVTSVSRRIEVPHRAIVICTSLLEIAGTGIVFRENGFVVMSDMLGDDSNSFSPHASSPTSQFQTFYQISAEPPPAGGDPTSSAHTRALQDFILDVQSEKRKSNLLQMQDVLVHQFPQVVADVDRFGSSPLIVCET
ncbi:hypothetical protein FI667_g11699, partial [Globisporangium splendens]